MKIQYCFFLCLTVVLGCTSSEKDPRPWDLNPVEDMQVDFATDIDGDFDSGTPDDMGFPGKVCEATGGRLSFKPRRNIEEVVGCVTSLSTIDLGFFTQPTIPLHWFESLREIGPGEHLLFKVTNIEDVNSFQNLERIGQLLSIIDATELGDISGFRRLRRVGALELDGVALRSLDGFESLEYIGGDLNLNNLYGVQTLDGFKSLRRVDGDFHMYIDQITEAQMRAFLERVEVGGEITFKGENWVP